jgi:RNA polymerase sigma factor (sigma-70 family)
VHTDDTKQTIEAVWRIESAKLIAHLTRMVRGDVGLAEDLAHEALVAALEQWPLEGVPDNPAAWLMSTAKRRAIDRFRREKLITRKHEQLARETPPETQLDLEALDDPFGDDLLRLIFMTCHPVLSPESQTALTLRLLGGLTTEEIARAFLTPEPTIAQRIVRAKRTLAEQHVPFEVPRPHEMPQRLASVLGVIYLIFNEGYSATAGDDWMRPALCEDAQRLARILAGLVPNEPEAHGLLALLEIQASRTRARTDASGNPILLLDQNRAHWDQLLISRGLAALQRAQSLANGPDSLGPYALQASIAACHARARTPDQTDWPQIASLYARLQAISPSPIIQLNRAVAVSMTSGPKPALTIVDQLLNEPSLKAYHLLPSVRADLLKKLGRLEEAKSEFNRAASLTKNSRERALLLRRAADCASTTPRH